MAYLFTCLFLPGASEPPNFFLLALGRLYDGVHFRDAPLLRQPDQDSEFNALPSNPLLTGPGPNVPNSVLLEIFHELLHYAFGLSQSTVGEHDHKFADVKADEKPPNGAKVFIDEASQPLYRLLTCIVPKSRDNVI
jgi:hypothetical protein